MSNTKYKLTDEAIEHEGVTLYRICALRDIGDDVHAGNLGGYIASERNLSTAGDAWVYGDARVYGKARVSGNALVCGEAQVSGGAWVCGNTRVS